MSREGKEKDAGGPARGPLSLEELVAAALAEDVGTGDVTTRWTVPEGARGTARVVAREAGVLAGREAFAETFRQLDPELRIAWRASDGDRLDAGDEVVGLEGPLAPLLTGERTALEFLGRLSGIATLTARYVEALEGLPCRVTDTRKTTPGWRRLEKAATAAGGAANHRMGLWDMALVKENHVRAAGGMAAAAGAALREARGTGLRVEVEVRDLDELEEALAASPDRILLDNMEPEDLRRAVRRARSSGRPPTLEASGGVTLATVRAVAETGVDLVSVGALTHSAPSLDLSLLVETVEEA